MMNQMSESVSKNTQQEKERNKLLQRYNRKASAETKSDFLSQGLSILNEEQFQSSLNQHIRLIKYMQRIYTLLDWYGDLETALLALFDGDGCLIELCGPNQLLENAAHFGIRVRSQWGLKQAGVNAVSVGLSENHSFYTSGDENDCVSLKDYTIYFSSLAMQHPQHPEVLLAHGGVALLTMSQKVDLRYLTVISLIAHDLKVNTQFSDIAYDLYAQTGMGVLATDSKVQNGRILATFTNNLLFRIFGIPPIDIYFKPVDKLIDPLPKNEKFWSVFTEKKSFFDKNITLSVQGKEVNCIVTAVVDEQTSLNVCSINFLITTPQTISSNVSSRMGNSAVRSFENIIGESHAIKSTIERGKLLARSSSNIMLLGESGVGKDLFAQAIHNCSSRRSKPFIAINCGALPRELIASELFGYAGGAFTGANRQGNIGKFELASGGTIFLDEIGELPLDLQATLLRVVEQKQITRLGSSKAIDVDVKIISATNADIPAMIRRKQFRSDLYFRLSTMSLAIPPLRKRGSDIIILAEYFIRALSERSGISEIKRLSDDAKQLLMELPWPGNIRELENVMENIVYIYPGTVIEAQQIRENVHLLSGNSGDFSKKEEIALPESPEILRLELPWSGSGRELQTLIDTIVKLYPDTVIRASASEKATKDYRKKSALPAAPLPKKHRQLTIEEIRDASEACGGVRSEMAAYLGVGRATLYRRLKEFNL